MSEIRFSRGLGLRQVIARGASCMLVVTTLVVMGDVIAATGPLAPLAFLPVLLLLALNLLGYVELALRGPRPGGAYGLVEEAEGGALGFLTGWALTLAGVGLCGLLAHGFGVQLSILLRDHLALAVPAWPWAISLVLFVAVNNTLGTRDGQRGLLTALVALVGVLLFLLLLALPQVDLARYRGGPQNWGDALSLLVVGFVGLELTASLQGEMRQQERSVPRALLLTPVLVTVLGALTTAVVTGALDPAQLVDRRNPLAVLGAGVAGGAGRPLVLGVGALALALALNSTFVLVVRHLYVMANDGYWPTALRRLHPRFGTPVGLIALAASVLIPVVFLPPPFVSRLAGLLYLVVLTAVNLTLALRKPAETASFSLPFHPWVPGLTLVINLLVSPLWGTTYLAWGLGCLGAGVVIYLAYAQRRHVEAQEGVTVFKPPPEERAAPGYRILVPIANPATAGTLLRLAGVLARQQGGEVLALQVVTVPEQVPLDEGRHRAAVGRVLLERAMAQAKEEGFAVKTMTRVAHGVAEGILDTAREEGVEMILMGWRGYTRSAGASMGPIIDAVIRDAPCQITVAKGQEWEEAGRILVPTAGGPHAPIAAQLAMMLSEVYGSEVTALYVQLGRATAEQMEENKRLIARTLRGVPFSRPPEQKVVVAESVVEGIAREAEAYDFVLLGASEQGLFDQFVFGSIPQQVAARVDRTAVIVRSYGGPTEFWARKLTRLLLHVLPRLNVEEQLDLREAMRDSARPGANFFVLIVLSSIIAALGLLLNSAAVVIGAMLVAPLMSPILGFSLGMVLGDIRLVRLSIEAMFKGVVLALMIAVVIGAASPIRELTQEIMLRTQPTLLDLAVALASGMAGAYALSREEVSAALPGVAIAAALLPPLSAAGLGLSFGAPHVAGGAFLLFLANIAAISLAGAIVFILLGVRAQTWQPEARRRVRRGLMGFVLLVVVIAIPLGIIMAGIVQQANVRSEIRQVLTERVDVVGAELTDFEHRMERERLVVVATVRAVDALEPAAIDGMAAALGRRFDRPVTLDVITLPVVRSEG